MPRLLLPSLLALSLGACGSEPEARRLDATVDRAAVIEHPESLDPVVDVKGPTTIYVIQDRRVRALIEWPHQKEGRFAVPIRAVADDSGPLFIGLRRGPITKNRFGTWNTDWCEGCRAPAASGELEPCCPP